MFHVRIENKRLPESALSKNERFEYKQFDGVIDVEKNEVVMKDVLVATDAGKQTVALQDLEKAP